MSSFSLILYICVHHELKEEQKEFSVFPGIEPCTDHPKHGIYMDNLAPSDALSYLLFY